LITNDNFSGLIFLPYWILVIPRIVDSALFSWGQALLILGVFTQIAQLFMTKGFMTGDISIVTPFQYLGAIYAIMVGSLFFNEHLPYLSFIGIFLILGGVVVNILVRNIS
jgi:drug/metabolite transporter (DMT)-like permease